MPASRPPLARIQPSTQSGKTRPGVPIDAIMFGGRRATNVPLVREGFDWEHGVFLGSIMSSEMTAAAFGTIGKLRFDPFAMLPFAATTLADYWGHWLEGRAQGRRPAGPRIYLVTGSARTRTGKFMWPGFGENSRVIEWIFGRCSGEDDADPRRSGSCPRPAPSTRPAWTSTPRTWAKLFAVDPAAWTAEAEPSPALRRFGSKLRRRWPPGWSDEGAITAA